LYFDSLSSVKLKIHLFLCFKLYRKQTCCRTWRKWIKQHNYATIEAIIDVHNLQQT